MPTACRAAPARNIVKTRPRTILFMTPLLRHQSDDAPAGGQADDHPQTHAQCSPAARVATFTYANSRMKRDRTLHQYHVPAKYSIHKMRIEFQANPGIQMHPLLSKLAG